MRTLIVLCSDNRMVDDIPLCLNKYPDGKLLAYKTIEGIYANVYDRVIYVLLKENNDKYDTCKRIKENNFNLPIEFVILDEMTDGPAETVYNVITQANVTGEFAVRDSHSYIQINNEPKGDFVTGLDLTKYSGKVENLRKKSFISVNEQNKILDIVEKHFCSDIISTGYYGFGSVDDFVFAYNRLRDKNYSIDKLYLSHIISYLIGYKQKIYTLIDTEKYEDWDSSSAWQDIQNKNALVFVDIDRLISDGESIKIMRDLSLSGMQFVGYSNKKDTSKDTKLLKNNKINILTIVGECTYSQIKRIVNNHQELKNIYLGK